MEIENGFEGHWLRRVDEYRHVPIVDFGIGAAKRAGEIALGISKNLDAMIITDRPLRDLGLIEGAKNSLEDSGFTVEVLALEAREPTLEEIQKIREAVGKDCGLVVGLGGGSAMDKAKIAACLSENPGELKEYLCPSTKPLGGSKPKIMIPTTAGTGSEVSNTAVVIVPHKDMGTMKTWMSGSQILAEAALVDPALTLKCPPVITANAGMDALSHTAEGVLSIQANPYSDGLELKAIEMVSENLGTAYHRGTIEARWNMSLAAMIGGQVISYPWVAGPACLGHVVSEGISAKYDIPHGEACGVVLPYVYWYNLPVPYARKKLAMIAEAMGVDTFGLDDREAAVKAVEATFDLLEEVDMPTDLGSYGIEDEDIPKLSNYILERSEEMYAMSQYNPRRATQDNLEEFFRCAIEGRDSL